MGWVLSRETTIPGARVPGQIGVPRWCGHTEGETASCDMASGALTLRGLRPQARADASCWEPGDPVSWLRLPVKALLQRAS